jgi:hypothetical protein
VVITRTIQKPIKDADVSEAIALKANACFGALAFCRGISGAEETNEWWLAMKFGLKELVQEARDRNIDLITVVSSVERQPVLEVCACDMHSARLRTANLVSGGARSRAEKSRYEVAERST